MKYIDADKLKAEIEGICWFPQISSGYNDGREDMKIMVLDIITSLQQEQPEIGLEEEVENYFQGHWPGTETAEQCNTDLHFTPPAIIRLSRHFYNLGLNSRKK